MELDAKTKLRRYCFLGSLEPVYVHLHGGIDVAKFWPPVQELCKLVDDATLLPILREVLHECSLVRRDEPLFVYAAYLASDLDIKWKTAMRHAFPLLLRTDEDLFLFCKYATLIGKELKHKGFSKTVRKAITSWYEAQTPEALSLMWLTHRGAHGYTHKALIKLCHISDETIGAAGVASPFFKSCTELLKESEPSDIGTAQSSGNPTSSSTTETPKNPKSAMPPTSKGLLNAKSDKAKGAAEVSSSAIVSISKLRTTKNKDEALKIIRKFKLHYNQVPGHLLRYAPIMEALIPSMSYLQLLKCWRHLARFNHLKHRKIFKLCRSLLENKKIQRASNIYPITLLMHMHDMGIYGNTALTPKRMESTKMLELMKIFEDYFNKEQCSGGMRMHITLNLQNSYKKKLLKYHKKLEFLYAAVALAFGYFKREAHVDVFHWIEEKMKLEEVAWSKDMEYLTAYLCCKNIENEKNAQRLVAPIIQALLRKQVYDVFLAIVPSAGRGNPKQNSEFLCKFLDKYRQVKNPKAKFVILNLLKFKRSMSYSEKRVENILEICGLDDHTTTLINNFVTNRFD